ncbi:hypothetical protein AB0L33_16655 [Streptomyces sp. NPDC052299]|uniref:hypothetical protein n=1 Tax=Streptomyces sp. NPDC052299 TaxID=3155054 RepID=UPI00343517DB
MDETPPPPATPPPDNRPQAGPAAVQGTGGDGWGSFADEAPAASGGQAPPSAPPQPVQRPQAIPAPSPEVAASLLTAGETLWAEVDGRVAVLGSGCRVAVVPDEDGEAVADGFTGWRPVVVVDPAALTVRLVPLALADPPIGAATPVSELYEDPEPHASAASGRSGVFPVGQGPDLDTLLQRAVAEERAAARADAEARTRRAERELAEAQAEARARAEAAEARAAEREQRAQEASRRARTYAEQQIAQARDDVAAVVRQWQERAQWAEDRALRAEAEVARMGAELARAEQAGVLQHLRDRRRRANGGR